MQNKKCKNRDSLAKNPSKCRDFVEILKKDYPEFRFVSGKKFAFRPPRTIVVGPVEDGFSLLLLHELGHALLGHKDFRVDIVRLKMEVQAWEQARELANKYCVEFDDELMESELDTYRDWLHRKSACPRCGLTRFQAADKKYRCPQCDLIEHIGC